MNISGIVEQVITFGLADRLKAMGRVYGNFAAAGDPSLNSDPSLNIDVLRARKNAKDDKIDYVKL